MNKSLVCIGASCLGLLPVISGANVTFNLPPDHAFTVRSSPDGTEVLFVNANGDFLVNGQPLAETVGLPGPPGPLGPQGNTVLNGTGAPDAALGIAGDFYIDINNMRLYGPKTTGWSAAYLPMVGPQGPQGLTGLTGATGATGATGVAGPQGETGATGPEGPIGPQGIPGDQGLPGPVGPQGPEGPAGVVLKADGPCSSNTNRLADCGNGTLADSLTGLIWLADPDCALLASMDWAAAKDAAGSLGDGDCGLEDQSSRGDWRLPTPDEWQWSSATIFPGYAALAASTFWSSSTDGLQPTQAMAAQIDLGLISRPKTQSYRVWPVRGEQSLPSVAEAGQTLSRYLPTGANGEIIKDRVTGYEWQRCSVGQTWNATAQTCDGTAGTYDWNTAMATWPSNAAWRLPTIAELRSLVYCSSETPILLNMTLDYTSCAGAYQTPTIVSLAFPNTPRLFFLSSSPRDSNSWWAVAFTHGAVGMHTKGDDPLPVRLVRGGQ